MTEVATDNSDLLATGGGDATAGGVTTQGSIAASIAVQAISGTPLDSRLGLGAAKPIAFRFETEVPVDDVLVETNAGGWVFVQAKNSLTMGSSLTSELGKTCDEFARLWILSTTGDGSSGWNRPLVAGRDAMLIAVGSTSSGTVKTTLPAILDALRSGSTATLTDDEREKLTSFKALMRAAFDAHSAPPTLDIDEVLKFIYVMDYDFGGPHRAAAEAILANAIELPGTSPAAFNAVERTCQNLMSSRGGIDAAGLRTALAAAGTAVKAVPEFRADVEALRNYTQRVTSALGDFQITQLGGRDVTVDRLCTHSVVAAAGTGSLVIVGDPGAGKSAVVNQAAQLLLDAGNEVVLLAIDRLQVETVEGLAGELGIAHSLARVLDSWPGKGTAYLFLDALDACRFGQSEALFRSVIQQVLALPGGRWHVVASIRTFDLQVGKEFGRLFRGVPPDPAFVDPRFQGVRHVRISDWSDEEFEELLSALPALRTAIDKGGSKLAELARVPFNTRLLAELLSSGTAPEALANLGSQVQLLEMYWSERVQSLGAMAEQCLRTTLTAMVDRGRLEARSIDAGTGTGNALDELLRQGVLISLDGGRQVAFRHHILFDYAASRLLIDLDDLPATGALLGKAGSGLLLAPAFSFALRHLWENAGAERSAFWAAATYLIGDDSGDPIARSVAARAACDLPETPDDMKGLLSLIYGPTPDAAVNAFRHIVGSLSVRLEDDLSVPAAPWCFVAAEVTGAVDKVVWPLRQLVGNFIDRVNKPAFREQLGLASRAVLDCAFTSSGGSHLMPLAINFVGKTFGTDPIASKSLIERLLQPERMAGHAHEDMHWLAQEVGRISESDCDLVISIYERIFTHRVTDDAKTDMGSGRVLNLTSNRRQDYGMAEWSLKEAFPAFVERHPLEATDAALAVATAYTDNEHRGSGPKGQWTIAVAGAAVTLREDWSHIWASEFQAEHEDNAQQIVDALIQFMLTCPDADALLIAQRIVSANECAWIWARIFMAAARRGGALADYLWPFATKLEFLICTDTRKDAIDLIAAGYAGRTEDERRILEEAVIAQSFPDSHEPEDMKAYFQRKILCSIERTFLVTAGAIAVVDQAVSTEKTVPNDRPFRIGRMSAGHSQPDNYDWLRDDGVDIDAAPNRVILACITACESPRSADQTGQDVLGPAEELFGRLQETSSEAAPRILSYGWERLTHTLAEATNSKEAVDTLTPSELTLIEQMLDASIGVSLAGEAEEKRQFLNESRANAARAMLNIVRIDEATAKRYEPKIEALVADEYEGVRSEICNRIGFFWNVDREYIWQLATIFAAHETNARVLVNLVGFLIQAANDEPQKISTICQALLARSDIDDEMPYRVFREGMGTLIFHLWVHHADAASRATIDIWLANRAEHREELQHGAFSIRDALALYDTTDPTDERTRRHSQDLAFEIINATAAAMQAYIALSADERTEDRQKAVSEDAKLLDQMSDQFLFAVGATEIREEGVPKALADIGQRRQYLADNEATFRRIGDVGTPRTIYYLLQLLEFLMPADPARVFDLVTHCLLVAGRLHDYQTDSLGADQFVGMIATAIADHRAIFDDPARRIKLVEVLEVFVNAGWPSARRLLYRLPEALR